MPDPKEPVASISSCEGSLVLLPTKLGMKKLNELTTPEKIEALEKIINECDKGNEGVFNNTYAELCDMKWSQGYETATDYEKYKNHLYLFKGLFTDLLSFRGYSFRNRTRAMAMRFYLYLKAGYEIDFEW